MKFPFKNNDVVSFPDTDSEYVDVGIGPGMKVAETPYLNLLIVHKCGRGYRFELEYTYSEVFRRTKNGNKFITNKEYLNYFGDYSDMKYVCKKEDLELTEKEIKNL